jgi:phosphoglycerol transferase MdoB-like AlkP superfamily enzyme
VEVATSACASTNCGVFAVLASKTVGRQVPQNFKLHELLYDQGYNVYFILSGNHRWYNLRSSYGTSLTYYFDGTNSARYDWNDDRVIFEGLEKVPQFSGTPAFFYFHLVSLHSTGVRHEEHTKYRPARNWIELSGAEDDASAAINFYDNGVIQTDAIIKGIFEGLERKGYLDKSIVVILSDHGEGLGQKDHSLYGHVNNLHQESIRIPLLIYDDPQTKYGDLKYATQIDVAPTVVDRLGLEAPSCWQGRSLLGHSGSQYSFHQTATSFPSYAVIYRTGGAIYKYLRQYGQEEALYELVSDPGEKHNLIETTDPAIITHMREKMAESLANP